MNTSKIRAGLNLLNSMILSGESHTPTSTEAVIEARKQLDELDQTMQDKTGYMINDLCQEATRIATEHGFTDNPPTTDIALMHSEISEALEDIRDGRALDAIFYTKKVSLPVEFVVALGVQKVPLPDVKVEIPAPQFNEDGSMNKPCGVPIELADELIRIFHFAGKHGIDLADAVKQKMKYNETRPFRHGGKTC